MKTGCNYFHNRFKGDRMCLQPPLPVRRERAGVRVISNIERRWCLRNHPHPNLLPVYREKGPETGVQTRSQGRCPARIGRRPRARHGVIYILALGVTVVLTGMVLVFARNMRTESMASANRLSLAQADAIEKGAEQWALAQVNTYQRDAVTITQIPAEAIQVGDGYFWLLHPNPTTDQAYMAGIVDETSKLNINTAISSMLQDLPGMTPTAADSIIDWVDTDSTPSANGAESDFYGQLPEPYDAKNAPFETVEELMLVNGWSSDMLFGYNVNRDGVVDQNELAAAGNVTAFANANGNSRGMFNWLTCYSSQTNAPADASARTLVIPAAPVTPASVAATANALNNVLKQKLSEVRANQIISKITPLLLNQQIKFLSTFYANSGLTSDEFPKVFDYLTDKKPGSTLKGLININTAPKEVLECLPGITESDADALIAAQSTASSTPGIAWAVNALSLAKVEAIAGAITTSSYQYSADIVAVSGDGRAFKRVRIVLDATTLPAKIVYRRDLTSYGWPLPRQIQDSMRTGHGVVTGLFATPGNSQINGLPQ